MGKLAASPMEHLERVKSRTCFLTWILCKVSSISLWCIRLMFLAFQLLLFVYIPSPLKEVMFLQKKKDIMYLFTSGETWIDNFDYIPAPRFCIQGVMIHHPLRVPFGRHWFLLEGAAIYTYIYISSLIRAGNFCNILSFQLPRTTNKNIYVQSILPIHLVSRPL